MQSVAEPIKLQSVAAILSYTRLEKTQDVIDGHDDIVKALSESQQAHMILFKTQYLNSENALNNWVKLDKVVPLTKETFKPAGRTPLYDRTLSLLTSVVYKKTEALKGGHFKRALGDSPHH